MRKSSDVLEKMSKVSKLLVVDDEKDLCLMLKRLFERKGNYTVITSNSPFEALRLIKEWRPDVVITDVKMEGMSGIDLLKEIVKLKLVCSVIVITGYGTVEMAVEALKLGAYDFIEKPFDNTKVFHAVNRAVERTRLLRENERLTQAVKTEYDFYGIIGSSQPIQEVKALIRQVADSDETVLIRGESGTGKELAARAIHALSKRSKRQLISVNCAALPENILESELFGYAKGAFTGALNDKKGLFIEANRSSILLDEIGDMPVSLQTKLLRVLQEKEVRPLGSTRNVSIDVRVIASTNRDLEEAMADGSFREDLYYRLNVVTIYMPPLRNMKEDIPLLAHHFLKKFSIQFQKEGITFSEDSLICLTQNSWRGNIRELENTIKRAVLLNQTGKIEARDIICKQNNHGKGPCGDILFDELMSKSYSVAKKELITNFSIRYIENVLSRTKGNVTEAARISGMERQALQRLLRQYGIKSSHFKQ